MPKFSKNVMLAALLSTSSFAEAAPTAYYGLTIVDPVSETRTPTVISSSTGGRSY